MNVCLPGRRRTLRRQDLCHQSVVIRVENPCKTCVTLCANLERIGQWGQILFLERPIQYNTSDITISFTPAPTPCSDSSFSHVHCTHVHGFFFSIKRQSKSVRLTLRDFNFLNLYLFVFHNTDTFLPPPLLVFALPVIINTHSTQSVDPPVLDFTFFTR